MLHDYNCKIRVINVHIYVLLCLFGFNQTARNDEHSMLNYYCLLVFLVQLISYYLVPYLGKKRYPLHISIKTRCEEQ